MDLSRRSFIGGIIGAFAAPAVIRTPGLLMPVKQPTLITPRWVRIDHLTWDEVKELCFSYRVRFEGTRQPVEVAA